MFPSRIIRGPVAACSVAFAILFAGSLSVNGQDDAQRVPVASIADAPNAADNSAATTATSDNSEGGGGGGADAQALEAKRQQLIFALNEGKRLMRGNDEAGAENSLESVNQSPRGTWEWHMESVANLLRVAFSCRSAGDMPAAQRAARRVMFHLARAEKLAAEDPEKLTNIEELRGTMQEQFIGDTGEAVESYRRAVRQADRAKTNARQRRGGGGRGGVSAESRVASNATSAAVMTGGISSDADSTDMSALGEEASVRLRMIEGDASAAAVTPDTVTASPVVDDNSSSSAKASSLSDPAP